MTDHPQNAPISEPPPPAAPHPRPPLRGPAIGAALVVVVLLVAGLWQLSRMSSRLDSLESALEDQAAAADLQSLGGDLAALSDDVADLTGDLESLTGAVGELETRVAEAGGRSPITLEETTSALPRFEAGTEDQALGLQMPTLTGPDFYSGDIVSTSYEEQATVVMMFAHWCPFCQQELPMLSDLWETRRDDFPNVDLFVVSTGQDESRGNPETPYLEELQLPFPVIVDSGNALAAEAGLSAFPYWVFVGPDGRVLGRATGLIESEQLTQLFADLDRYASEN